MTPSPQDTSGGTPDPRFAAARVRRDFLDFFTERAHREVPSAPVFPQDDPTLLFTNAGMNQFKDVFLGTGKRDYTRAADTQKCIRASGKHNDLEDVGVDTYHHTFFEMLGNWSFGDYFKEDAIVWAWELLTKVWGLPKENLWATVFGGDEKDGLAADEEAERIWREKTDIDPSHVLRFDRTDNFWEMGDTGPCGPCSEIHIDRAGLFGEDVAAADGADPKIGVNAGNERFIELWNLVFMQFNRLDDGSLRELPAKHVDTGMGFERVTSVLQGKRSNYDTDLFGPIFERLGQLCGKTYGENEEDDIAFRVCGDHVRAVTAAFSDGALPSNTGRGYVLRRLIRRAARYGRQTLGLEDPFLFELVPSVTGILGETFPEMTERLEHVQLVMKTEEEAFARTLGRGLRRFEELAERTDTKELPGAESFELYATYGFPRDLVELMARERGMTVDSPGWDAAEKKHQDASRSEGTFKQLLSAEQLESLEPTRSTYHEVGDTGYEASTTCVYAEQTGDRAKLVLSESPFYAESGGQIGDHGQIEDPAGAWRFQVEDTQKVGPIVVHLGTFEGPAGTLDNLKGQTVTARVARDERDLTRKNHTATHLMHKALKMVLGDHVAQQGSYVGPDRLRFDFSHPKGVTADELDEIERIVNGEIVANHAVTHEEEDRDEAIARGVVAMFGEKYDERVKVLDVGGWSVELCGGTHVRASGDIGPFVILSERAVAAGVRRIEAVTGPAAVQEMQRQRGLLRETALSLKTAPDDVPSRVAELQKKIKEAKKQQKASAGAEVGATFEALKKALDTSGPFARAVLDCPSLDGKALRDVADRAKALAPDLALALLGRAGGKVPFLIISQGAAREAGFDAGELAKGLGPLLGGGGGGRPEMAQGQGARAEGAEEALRWLQERVLEQPTS